MIGMSRRGNRNKQYLKNLSQNQNSLQSIPECMPLSVEKSNAHHSEWHMSPDMAMPLCQSTTCFIMFYWFSWRPTRFVAQQDDQIPSNSTAAPWLLPWVWPLPSPELSPPGGLGWRKGAKGMGSVLMQRRFLQEPCHLPAQRMTRKP